MNSQIIADTRWCREFPIFSLVYQNDRWQVGASVACYTAWEADSMAEAYFYLIVNHGDGLASNTGSVPSYTGV